MTGAFLCAAFAGLVAGVPLAAQQPVPSPPSAGSRDTVPADTLGRTRLPDLEVRVARTEADLRRLPFAVRVLDAEAARRARLTTGIDELLTRLPGVVALNRWNYSLDQRLSLRGAGSRANFGIRGVKILVDGVPQTLPDGQGQLTNLDLGVVERVEAITGSAGALYGNASGGVIAFETETPRDALAVRARTIGGAFGTWKAQAVASGRGERTSGLLSLSWFNTDGFRQNSAAESRLFVAKADHSLSPLSAIGVSVSLAQAPRAENPGALTAAEYAARRDSAAGNNILRGADKDVSQEQAALRWRWRSGGGAEAGITLFGLHRDLVNPLATPPPTGTGPTVGTWNAIQRYAGGARITGGLALGMTGTVRLSGGIDLQKMRDDRRNERSVSGAPTGEVLADQRETVTEAGAFVQAHWTPTERLLFLGAVRGDRLTFRVRDRHLADGADQSGERTFESLSGSAGASVGVGETATLYGNVSTSFETPTTTELVNRPGSTAGFNPSLEPQRTVTVEAGARGALSSGALDYSVAVFAGRVRDAIVQAREVSGRAFFANAGRVRVRGVEAALGARLATWLRVDGTYTLAALRFDEYRVQNGAAVDTLDGNRVPGVPRHFLRLVGTATLGRLTLELDQTTAGHLFADDPNRIRVDGWKGGVTALRASGRIGAGGAIDLAPFGAVENLFDRRYVGSVTINGVGGRVLEPAAGRQAYVGVEVRWRSRRPAA